MQECACLKDRGTRPDMVEGSARKRHPPLEKEFGTEGKRLSGKDLFSGRDRKEISPGKKQRTIRHKKSPGPEILRETMKLQRKLQSEW